MNNDCPRAATLRATWYAIAQPLDWFEEGLQEKLFLDHGRPSYQRAMQDYVSHRKTCLDCCVLMAAMAPAPVAREKPQIKAFEEALR